VEEGGKVGISVNWRMKVYKAPAKQSSQNDCFGYRAKPPFSKPLFCEDASPG
jgi:hypothetical protein